MLPLSVLTRYLQEVETALEKVQGVVIDAYVEELLTPARANLRIRLHFDNGRLLEINEAAFSGPTRLPFPQASPG